MNMFRESMLNEASFSVKDLRKVAITYGKLFGKEFGGTFKPFNTEWYKKSKESGQGVRMINKAGRQLRINFSNRTSNFANAPKDFVVLSSIDYWDQNNSDDACPTTTCYFTIAVNVVKIWKKLGQLIRTGKAGKYSIGDFADQVREGVNEGVADTRAEFLAKHGGAKSRAGFKKDFEAWVDAKGLRDEWTEFAAEIEPGKPEQNGMASEVKKNEKALEEHKWCDPKTIFDMIEKLTNAVIRKITRSFVLCGMGGVGKTYHVNKKLKEVLGPSGKSWYSSSGKTTSTSSFYDELFYARDKIFLCDEADSVLQNPEIVVMLKPTLDTSGSNTVEYSMNKMPCYGMSDAEVKEYSENVDKLIQWGVPPYMGKRGPSFIYPTEKGQRREPWLRDKFMYDMEHGLVNAESIEGYWAPSKFFFTGGIIFISNMAAKDIDQALMSRSAFIDLWLTAQDTVIRISDILHNMYPDESALVDEVIEYLSKPGRTKQITVRSGTYAMKLIQDPETRADWKEMIEFF